MKVLRLMGLGWAIHGPWRESVASAPNQMPLPLETPWAPSGALANPQSVPLAWLKYTEVGGGHGARTRLEVRKLVRSPHSE